MRHLVKKSKLNKPKDHREAMIKNLAAQVIQYEKINTTKAKAKAVAPYIDKIIRIGKKKDLHARRELQRMLFDELAVMKVLEVLADKYLDKTSGFTSIVKLGTRSGDRSEIVRIMLSE